MILHRQVAQQRASLERLINNRHIYSMHVITHCYSVFNGDGQNGLMEAGIATASDQRPQLMEA